MRTARFFITAWVLLLALAGCGGGSSGPPPSDQPVIQQYQADRASYGVGDVAKLTVRFTGGTGRIEPAIGPVSSGVTVDTPPLDVTTSYELIVESSAGTARRQLTLNVAYRDRYRAIAQAFPIAHHSAVLAGDGSVVIIGGSRGSATLSDSIDRFDPRTERFTKIGALSGGPIIGDTATRLADGRILVAGGARLLGGQPENAETIDEKTGVVTLTGIMRARRSGHAATVLPDGRVLFTGGTSTEGFPGGISPTAEIWDHRTGEFRLLASRMNTARAHHTATLLEDGRVLVVGGYSFAAPYVFAEIFDPATEEFGIVPSNETVTRAQHVAAKVAGGSVLIVGGEDDGTEPHGSVLLWNRSSGTFETMPSLMVPRSVIRAAITRDDGVLMFGGVTRQHPVATGSAEGYTRAAGGAALPPMPNARAWHTVTRLADGRVLILGGDDDNGALISQALMYE
jgi:hypothetical protein